MSQVPNPAWNAFAARIKDELVLAQVLISRQERGFELRHINDRLTENAKLHSLTLGEIRSFSQTTATGAFRPLKSAPNLSAGWRLLAANESELEFALNQLYPNAVADWFAIQSPQPPLTHYRAFTQRQSGMYRITTMLDDQQTALVIRVCCDKKFCLKQRLWTVESNTQETGSKNNAPPDLFEEKSLVPCLEPCAILLEFARKAVRLEQQRNMNIDLADDEVRTLRVALDVLSQRGSAEREADFNSPTNPRRIELLRQKFASFPVETNAVEKE